MPKLTETSNMPKNTPQAVIDTNILVRANISKNGSDYLIYKAFLDDKFELLYSEKTIQEINRVLNYPRIFNKYHFDKQMIEEFIESIITFGKFVYAQKDELISIALTIYTRKPIYIVSGDEDLLVLRGKIRGVRILTANEFVLDKKSF